jgi:hypothetical protein
VSSLYLMPWSLASNMVDITVLTQASTSQ